MMDVLDQPIKSMFGKVDKKHIFDRETGEYKGEKIASSYPAYMHGKAIQDLKQSIDDMEDAIEHRRVSSNALEYTKRRLKKEKKLYEDIYAQIPQYTPTELRNISDGRKRLDKEIESALFTKSDMEKRAHLGEEEAKRMSTPCIKVDKFLADICHVKLVNGKCTRSEAEKIRKMAVWQETGGERVAYTDELRKDLGSHQGKSNMVTVDGSLVELEEARKQREREIDIRLAEIEKGESSLDDISFIVRLKEHMKTAEGMNDAEIERLLKYYAKVALKGTIHGNLHATVSALKAEDSQEELELENKNEPVSLLTAEDMWTCPDCKKEIKVKGKGLHKTKWCPELKKDKE